MNLNRSILYVILLTVLNLQILTTAQTDTITEDKSEWEAFPILTFDSDAGFGYGAKGFFYNFLNDKESFDLILYNSTKGEHWYRLVFSDMDIQRRQGKKYTAAIDLIADYDKWINYKYYYNVYEYGDGENTERSANYDREILELSAMLSKGFVDDFVAEIGLKFKSCNAFGLNTTASNVYLHGISKSVSHIQLASLVFNFRWDTRKNYINPENGFVMELRNELAHDILHPPDQNFFKTAFIFQNYVKIFLPRFVFANRLVLQSSTEDVSFLLKLPLGGVNTIRGLPQDRYLCESLILINSELRFPIWWRFGGIVGADIGNSNTTPHWITDPVAGLRFYMNNFVVRFDIGFGDEKRFYFNFGHMF